MEEEEEEEGRSKARREVVTDKVISDWKAEQAARII